LRRGRRERTVHHSEHEEDVMGDAALGNRRGRERADDELDGHRDVGRAWVGLPLSLSCSGAVSVDDMRTVVHAVRRAISRNEAHHDRVEIRIEHAANPSHSEPVAIEVIVVGPGRDIRTRGSAATTTAAATIVHDKLRRQLRTG
jgi:ribosome-associated translation inhibitor RaiA